MIRHVRRYLLLAVIVLSLFSLRAPAYGQNSTGGKIAYGTTMFGTLNADFPAALWVFEGHAGEQVDITISRLTDNLAPDVHLNQMQSSAGSAPTTDATLSDDKTTATISLKLEEDSPYQIVIQPSEGTSGEYQLMLSGAGNTAPAPNTAAPTPTPAASLEGTYNAFMYTMFGGHEELPGPNTEGTLTIAPNADAYDVQMAFGNTEQTGYGFAQDNFLSMTYGDKGCTVGMFHLNATDGLDAIWTNRTEGLTSAGTEHFSRTGAYDKASLDGTYVVRGTNPNGGKPYGAKITIKDWASYYAFNWQFGKESIRGNALRKGDLLAVVSGDSAGKLRCNQLALNVIADSSLEGTGTGYGPIFLKAISTQNTKTDPILLNGDYTVTRSAPGNDPESGTLNLKSNLAHYSSTWTFSSAQDQGVALRWGDVLAETSGDKGCFVSVQRPEDEYDVNHRGFYVVQGNEIFSPDDFFLVKFSSVTEGATATFGAKAWDRGNRKYIDGKLDVFGEGDNQQVTLRFGTNEYKGVALQQEKTFAFVASLSPNSACTMRLLKFKEDGSFEGKELSLQDATVRTLVGTPNAK